MRKALFIAIGTATVVVVDHPAFTAFLATATVVGMLVLVARLTDSPLTVSHAHTETWFDHPEGELAVRGARRASAPRRA